MKKTDKNLFHLLEYIKEYYTKYSFYPSQREMADAQDVHSTSTITYYLKLLEEKGLLKRQPSKNRAFEIIFDKDVWKQKLNITPIITKKTIKSNICDANSIIPDINVDLSNYVNVPVVGLITAGEPILAVENLYESFKLPYNLFGKDNIFILDVKGESMINAGIMSGDRIVVFPQKTANNGDIVVAMIDDYATVKTFYKEDGYIRLQPENDTMEPIISDNVSIIGKVIGLLRNY